MSQSSDHVPLGVRGSKVLIAALGLAAALALPWEKAGAADEKAAERERTDLGKNASAAGALLQRGAAKKDWQPLKVDAPVASGDQLMALPGSRGQVDVKDGAVRLVLWGNLPELSRFPGLESVAALNRPGTGDLDFTLDRGRVVVVNRKNTDPVKARVRFQGKVYELSLEEPGTQVALELYGMWPRGTPFVKQDPNKKKLDPEESPTVSLVLLVLKGQVVLKTGAIQFSLQAPPGPALFHWDSIRGEAPFPRRQEKLPPWAQPDGSPSPEAKSIQSAVKRLQSQLQEKGVAAALREARSGHDALARELAVYGLGAIDDLAGLVDALGDTKHADVRDTAVAAIRHWIGRGPGQDQDVYNFLLKRREYSEGQAEIVLQLLHGFDDDDRDRPETYETLIAYLRNSKLPIRELAQWQLHRWVPAGKDIAYDPGGTEEERERAYTAWKRLIPDGKLPPRPREK